MPQLNRAPLPDVPRPDKSSAVDVRRFIAEVKERIDARLAEYLAEKRDEVADLSPDSVVLVDGIESLTMRGGKRLRPVLLAAAHRAVAPDADSGDAINPGASLELLQSFLLIHDDWMDSDDERRGGPAVHAWFRERLGQAHLSNCLAVLAGDLSASYAWELFIRTSWPADRRRDAEQRFLDIHKKVFLGQHLDLTAHEDVKLMHQLKTGSYTVAGPLVLGALLGSADEAQIAAIERAGDPLGQAFQLTDDLLGTFGDPSVTGKPAGNDLRAGKHNAVVAAAAELLDESKRGPLDVVLGMGAEADESQVARAIALLEEAGVRAHVEGQVAELLASADAVLTDAPLASEGVTLLRELARLLAQRHR